jgi:hypothetical protein
MTTAARDNVAGKRFMSEDSELFADSLGFFASK